MSKFIEAIQIVLAAVIVLGLILGSVALIVVCPIINIITAILTSPFRDHAVLTGEPEKEQEL